MIEYRGRVNAVQGADARFTFSRTGVSSLALAAACLLGVSAHAQDTQGGSTDPTVAEPDGEPNNGAATGSDTTAVDTSDDANAIVVTGFRQSLQNAQSRKRDSDTIQDSVTAEDIGALPDRSVTETLQRIPGISINRFAAGVDPDHFSAEGSGVVVRGLTYVRSEFNGREAFTANNGRALGFADVPSELLGGVDVFKSPTADRIEGGIAGVVNLRTRLPFDKKGLVVAGSLELNYSDFIKKASPTAAIVASNTWDTPVGEFGFLGSFSYSKLLSRADRLQVSSFRVRPIYTDGTRTDVVPFDGATQDGSGLFPRGAVLGRQEFDRRRYGYAAAAQWRSNDRSMELTLQFLRSDARQYWQEHTVEIATDNVTSNGDSRATAGTSINFDEDGLFESGTITGPTGYRDDQNTPGNIRTPIFGLQSNNIRRDHDERAVTSDYAANFKWNVTPSLALNVDYQHVASRVDVTDNTMWTSSFQDAQIRLNGSDLADVAFLPPQNCESANVVNGQCTGEPGTVGYPSYYTGAHQSFNDPYNSFYRTNMDHIEQSDGNSDAIRLDLEYSFPEDSFLKAIRVGGRYADRDQTARFSTYNWGRLSEIWGNGGPVWLDDNVDGIPGGNGGAPLGITENYCFDNFFQGSVGNPLNGQCRPFYAGNTVKNQQEYVNNGNLINREWEPTVDIAGRTINGGWRALADRPGVVPGTPFLPGEINPQQETNKAGYVMARFGKEFGGGSILSGNIGVRYTTTKRASQGFITFPLSTALPTAADCATSINTAVAATPGSTTSVNAFCALTADQLTSISSYLNGASFANDSTTSYDYWLPSFNVKFDTGKGLQFRAAYFKGIAPPDLGLLRNYFPVALTASPNVNAQGQPIPIVVTPVADGTGQFGSNGTIAPGQVRLSGSFNAGNPRLLPITADNFDLTAEWYFSKVGQLTASLFYKRLKNVLTNSTVRQSFTNNGQTFDAVVSSPVNSTDTGKVKGVEVAYQQVYDFLPGFLKGLGLQANYTFVKSTGVRQSTLNATDPDVAAGNQPTISGDGFPLQGLSKHQFNITPFIDIGPLSMRASYNWRSRYLLTLRDVITPFDPIFQESYGQVDASITYSLTDQIKVGVQGVNLTNAQTRTTAAVLGPDGDVRYVPRGWYMNDRRYTAVLRFNF